MDSDSDSETFHCESEFYCPEELDRENNQNLSNHAQVLTRNNENFEDKIKTCLLSSNDWQIQPKRRRIRFERLETFL